MIGDGCCTFVSISLGAKNKERAHQSIGNTIPPCVIASLVLTVLYQIFRDPILTAFGGRVNAEIFAQSKESFTYIAVGFPFTCSGRR